MKDARFATFSKDISLKISISVLATFKPLFAKNSPPFFPIHKNDKFLSAYSPETSDKHSFVIEELKCIYLFSIVIFYHKLNLV